MFVSKTCRSVASKVLRHKSFFRHGIRATAVTFSPSFNRFLAPLSMTVDDASQENKQIENSYQKLTQREHILKRPDSYIGSVQTVSQEMWVYDEGSKSMRFKTVKYNPGLLKIFDEILVNAVDNKQRCPEMSVIKVTVDRETNTISIYNDGDGIPVTMHSEYNTYIPSLIFGQLLSGTNFDDNTKKVTGGRNGFGAKLTNIYSTEFRVETVANEKRFVQVFRNNMSEEEKPKVTKATKSKQFTKITFKPDLSLFGMSSLDDDMVSVLQRRVYDVAGVTDESVRVYWNNERLNVHDFQDYVKLYNKTIQNTDFEGVDGDVGADERVDSQVVFGASPRWQFAAIATPNTAYLPFSMSFVNGVFTSRGGKHVSYLTDQIVNHIQPMLEKRLKRDVKPSTIRQHLCVFCNCLIENPTFDSQTKEYLSTTSRDFGSTPKISNAFLSKLERSGLVDYVASSMKIKDTQLLKKNSGVKASRLLDISKLDDANNAGTKKSDETTLIITEGDSAKALAVGGLGVIGRDNYGVFPLKGKVLNVRDISEKQCAENEEIQNLVRILGLKYGKEYKDTSSLRYGHLLVMTDQDYDGSHIKGLVLNLFQTYWPSLLRLNYVSQFITPIIKVSRKGEEKMFYTMKEYNEWNESTPDAKKWHIKYYKGLGTSTAKEGKEYFSNLQRHVIPFASITEEEEDMIDMCFKRNRCEERKQWMNKYDGSTYIDYNVNPIPIVDFINKELIQYSRQDCIRSIPSMIDGLKPSQRKVLYGCFKRNLTKEIKVIQLSGYISENVLYHHGEQSLNQTIVSMAQDFVGSNNINYLVPNGQFGTRIMGGKDSASPRYIYTYLHPIARYLFKEEDECLLTRQEEEGILIEPKNYLPILPTVLVNGATGIGTGWSTTICNHNPIEVADRLIDKLQGKNTTKELQPWYRGFTGKMQLVDNSYHIRGCYSWKDDNTLVINELPVGKWTQEYKQFLCTLLQQNALISGFKENHTDTEVMFTLSLKEEVAPEYRNNDEKVMKDFKLTSIMSTTNYYLFDSENHIKHYENAEAILDEFIEYRLPFYQQRREAMLKTINSQKMELQNKSQFISNVVNGSIVLKNRSLKDVEKDLVDQGLKALPSKSGENSFEYLLSMPLSGLTSEKQAVLEEQKTTTEQKEVELQNKTSKDLWIEDLQLFRETFIEMERKRLADLVVRKKSGNQNGFSVDNYFESQVM